MRPGALARSALGLRRHDAAFAACARAGQGGRVHSVPLHPPRAQSRTLVVPRPPVPILTGPPMRPPADAAASVGTPPRLLAVARRVVSGPRSISAGRGDCPHFHARIRDASRASSHADAGQGAQQNGGAQVAAGIVPAPATRDDLTIATGAAVCRRASRAPLLAAHGCFLRVRGRRDAAARHGQRQRGHQHKMGDACPHRNVPQCGEVAVLDRWGTRARLSHGDRADLWTPPVAQPSDGQRA